MKKDNKLLPGIGLLTAISASLCCITPVLAFISGAGGLASSFSWLEPIRPYLIGFTIIVLAFAWYNKLKPTKKIDCDDCEEERKTSFWYSKIFLLIITLFSLIMLAFPYYSSVFYPIPKNQTQPVENSTNVAEISFTIEGMTCVACEKNVTNAIHQLNGIIEVETSYEKGSAFVKYDYLQVTDKDIENAINSTSYKATLNQLTNPNNK